jgi:hypothetical protein
MYREQSVDRDRKKYAKEEPLGRSVDTYLKQQALTKRQLLNKQEKVDVENRKMANQLAATDKVKGEDIYLYVYMNRDMHVCINA